MRASLRPTKSGRESGFSARPNWEALLPAAVDQLDPVAVGILALAELIQACPDQALAPDSTVANSLVVDEPVIERAEVVALLFNVSDIVTSLRRIELLLGEDDGEEEADGS